MTRWDVPQRRKAVCWSVCAVDLYKEWAGSCPVWAQRPPGSANLETFQSHCRGRKNEKIFIACMQRLYTDIKALETNLLHERSWVDLITTTQSQMSQRGQFLQDGETVCRHKHAITGMRKTLLNVNLLLFAIRQLIHNYLSKSWTHLKSRFVRFGHLFTIALTSETQKCINYLCME